MTLLIRDGSGELTNMSTTEIVRDSKVNHVSNTLLTDNNGNPISLNNGLPIRFIENTFIKVRSNLTKVIDYSGVMAKESKMALPANMERSGLTFQNLSTNNLMSINFGSSASFENGSIVLPPLGLYEMPSSMITPDPIYIFGTEGDHYTLKESTSQIIYSPSVLRYDQTISFIAREGQISYPIEINKSDMLMVWINGIKLNNVDYSYNQSTISFTKELSNQDEVEIIVFKEEFL